MITLNVETGEYDREIQRGSDLIMNAHIGLGHNVIINIGKHVIDTIL